jgi:hypothetical protein
MSSSWRVRLTVFWDVDDRRYPEKYVDLEEPAISTFITPLLIYVFTPILGVGVFWALIHKMRSAMVVSPPVVPYFILFFTLGGWLTVLLTVWFWEWSGMASLGMLYLILVAPILTAFMSWRLRLQRTLSRFHAWAFYLSMACTCLVVVGVPVAYVTLLGMR